MSFRGAAMDHNMRSVHHQRSSKAESVTRRSCRDDNKKQKKQVKVVYISNPVHFKASASEFKGLVQQFTGQDSDVAELFAGSGGGADTPSLSTDDDHWAAPSRPAGAALQLQQEEPYKWAGVPAPFDAFDEVFTPQALENLAAFMPASLYYNEPPPHVV